MNVWKMMCDEGVAKVAVCMNGWLCFDAIYVRVALEQWGLEWSGLGRRWRCCTHVAGHKLSVGWQPCPRTMQMILVAGG